MNTNTATAPVKAERTPAGDLRCDSTLDLPPELQRHADSPDGVLTLGITTRKQRSSIITTVTTTTVKGTARIFVFGTDYSAVLASSTQRATAKAIETQHNAALRTVQAQWPELIVELAAHYASKLVA